VRDSLEAGAGSATGTGSRISQRVAIVLAVVALTTLPTLLAAIPPEGLTGFGTVMFVNDFAQYEAAMNHGRRTGDWLLVDHFTPEPHRPALMFPMYVALGRLAGLVGTSWEPPYRVAELIARIALGSMLVAFGRRFALGNRRGATIALLLAGSGIGLWASIAQLVAGVGEPYAGNGSYELNTYLLFFGTPHAAIGMALTLAALWILMEANDRLNRSRILILGACLIALGLIHPFNVVSVGLASGFLVALAWFERKNWRPGLIAALVVGLCAAPFVVYNGLTFALDPFWGSTYGAQNKLPSPSPAELIVDLGVLLLGLVGIVAGWRAGGTMRPLALVAAVLFVAMYAPVPFQRRLGFGVTPLLAILTMVALEWIGAHRPRLVRPLTGLVFALALTSTLFFYGGMLFSTRLNTPIPAYRATPELAAARQWLAINAEPSDVVLGSWDVVNYLAGDLPGRTAGGHPVATAHVEERRARARELFASAEQQRNLLRAEGATYVVSTGAGEPLLLPDLDRVFQSGAVVVARTRP
jgi:hypothetical protein